MDVSMPGGDGIAATREIVLADPGTRVVMLTSFRDSGRVQRALQAGAIGYVLKDAEPQEVVAAVRSAAAGHAPIDARAARALLPDAAPPRPVLSPREEEVLALLAEGLANKQIAQRLGVAERTVKVHVGNVFRRIGVADRTSAALWFRDNPPERRGREPGY
jgi:DNA-binding NarL/FixJ family response regulator